jgi:hypothetical protein
MCTACPILSPRLVLCISHLYGVSSTITRHTVRLKSLKCLKQSNAFETKKLTDIITLICRHKSIQFGLFVKLKGYLTLYFHIVWKITATEFITAGTQNCAEYYRATNSAHLYFGKCSSRQKKNSKPNFHAITYTHIYIHI